MEYFSQTKDNRNKVIAEICERVGLKNDETFRRLSSEDNINILNKLKEFQTGNGNKLPVSNIPQLKPEDIEQVKLGDLDYTIKLLKDNNFDTIKILEIVDNALKPLKNEFSHPTDNDVEKLNESLTELKTVLSKNNKRWGHSYHLKNSYYEILNFIDKKIYDVQLKDAIVSVDNSYHIIILNEYISGGTINPIFKDYSSVKSIISDTQGLIFDMVVLIHRYFLNNVEVLEYINRDSLNKYNFEAETFFKNCLSSAYNSILFNKSDAIKNYLNINNELDKNSDFVPYMEYNNILDLFANNINSKDIKYDIWGMNIRSVAAMIQFIASSVMQFNLKIRNILKNYCNASLSLIRKIDKIKSNPTIYTYKN